MPYTSPAAQSSGGVAPVSWATAVKAALDFLANPPTCRVYRNTTQSINSATNTAIQFNAERFDTDTMHDPVTNNTRITFTTAGVYTVTGNLEWAASPGTNHGCWILLNGATIIDRSDSVTANGRMRVETVYKFAAGDYVELIVVQNTGAAVNIASTGNYSPEFAAVYEGLG